MRRWLWLAGLVVLGLGCASRYYVVPTNEGVSSWIPYRTHAAGSAVVYKLPPNPRERMRPRQAAIANPTSDWEQTFAAVAYGYDPAYNYPPEMDVWFQTRSVPDDSIDSKWSMRQFAEYFWTRAYKPDSEASPWSPPFEPLIDGELVEIGGLAWYHLSFYDIARVDRPPTGDDYIRPLSPSRALAIGATYMNYERMSREAIERRRALLRKIVAEVRIEPPFGPVTVEPPP